MSSNTGSGNQGTAKYVRVQATTQALIAQTGSHGQSGSPGPSNQAASRSPVQQGVVRAGSGRTDVAGTPNVATVDRSNTQGRLASPARIVSGQVRATSNAPGNPEIGKSPSRSLGSPARPVSGQPGSNHRSPISTAGSSPSPSRHSEAGTKSEASSGSPGSGIYGRNTSQASASGGDSPCPVGTAHPGDSMNNGEGFIRRIMGQAWNAGSSNPPTDFVLCIDGTGNDMVNEIELKNTNIARLTDLIKFGTHEGRMTVVAYQQGLGNEGTSKSNDEKSRAGWGAKLSASLEQLFPSERRIARLVAINYAYISMNARSNKEDRIFLFGFSRGAYIAQITAALVADLGILSNEKFVDVAKDLERNYPQTIHDIVNLWLKRQGTVSAERIKSELGPRGECLIPATIQFLGLFDMVASVGAPDLADLDLQSEAFRFAESIHNRPNILKACHAVAISEHRLQFKPVLWERGANNQSVSQVWFPGYHASIGGGTKKRGLMIYYITLVWMLSKCNDLHHVIDKRELEKLIVADAKIAATRPDKEAPFLIPDSKKGVWKTPVLGEHVRSELGSAPIDMVHRVCDPDMWIMRCAPQMPGVDGTAKRPIRTKHLLQQKLIDKPNNFELDFYDKVMFHHGPGQRGESVSPPNKAGRDMAHILE